MREQMLPAWGLIAGLGLGACGGRTIPSSLEDAGPADEGVGGEGGSGGSEAAVASDRVDLLFMIDNSASMADKQRVLAATIPGFVHRLANPHCVNEAGGLVARVDASAACPAGSFREFPPVTDMHVGIITSSLGGHGADSCSDVLTQNWSPEQEEMSHLVTRGPGGSVATYEDKGFLNWDPTGRDDPEGDADPTVLSGKLASIAHGVGQAGCGFESSLEAWYRFLVDPEPYERMVPVPCSMNDTSESCRGPEGIDMVVLRQRADFLRQDSVVAIVMLTDENDCSVRDSSQHFLALQALDGTQTFRMVRGTESCKTDPWGPDCKSCWEVSAAVYPECAIGWADPAREDALNVRCFRQKERFGVDFLQPVERYISALTETHLPGGMVNPLFCRERSADGLACMKPMRSRSQVVLAGILGVPWQSIAKDPENLAAGYRQASEIDWALILGEPKANLEPLDPLMVESIEPRTGVHPVTGEALVPPGGGVKHSINGAEHFVAARNDLQYACIFRLPEPIDCSLPENEFSCDCNTGQPSPLCWSGTEYGTMQYFAKAYPGRRHLSVLRGVGDQAVLASICAPNLTNPGAPDYGYGPALDALTRRLGENLRPGEEVAP